MAYLKNNRLIFISVQRHWVSVCIDHVFKKIKDPKLFEHGISGEDGEYWILRDDEIDSVDHILFPSEHNNG
jgi:hypothetical protein